MITPLMEHLLLFLSVITTLALLIKYFVSYFQKDLDFNSLQKQYNYLSDKYNILSTNVSIVTDSLKISLENIKKEKETVDKEIKSLKSKNTKLQQKINKKKKQLRILNTLTNIQKEKLLTEIKNYENYSKKLENTIITFEKKRIELQKLLDIQNQCIKKLKSSRVEKEIDIGTKKSSSKNATFYYDQALIKLESKDYEGAKIDFDKAIKLNSKIAILYNSRGLNYIELGNYERALKDFDKAIELSAAFYFNRSLPKFKLDKDSEAIDDLKKAEKMGSIEAFQILQELHKKND